MGSRLTGGTVLCPCTRHIILYLVLVEPKKTGNLPAVKCVSNVDKDFFTYQF